jgi:hypothetical protein
VAVDVPALIGAEEDRRIGDLLGRSVARHGDQVVVGGARRLVVRELRHLGFDGAGRDVVDVDAELRKLHGHDLGQELEARLG